MTDEEILALLRSMPLKEKLALRELLIAVAETQQAASSSLAKAGESK